MPPVPICRSTVVFTWGEPSCSLLPLGPSVDSHRPSFRRHEYNTCFLKPDYRMLKKLAFRLSLSSALRDLGINEFILNSQLSTEVVDQARKMGLTPKEVAIGIYVVPASCRGANQRGDAKSVGKACN